MSEKREQSASRGSAPSGASSGASSGPSGSAFGGLPGGVLVRVPCSTSNIGPGFDTLGLALNLYNDFVFRPLGDPDAPSRLSGRGTCAGVETENNVCLAMMRRVAAAAAELHSSQSEIAGLSSPPPLPPLPAVEITAVGSVPLGVGLGSSATACVAGAMAANHFLGSPLTKEQLLTALADFEEHPDNVTPSLFGGFTVSAMLGFADNRNHGDHGDRDNEVDSDDIATPKRSVLTSIYSPAPNWRVAILIPDYTLSTIEARKALPAKVRRADATFNLQRLPFVIEAIVEGNAARLAQALDDRLHEHHRAKHIKRYRRLREAAKQAGAAAVFISGSGPALAALCDGDAAAAGVQQAMQSAAAGAKFQSTALILRPDLEGAKLAEAE